MSISNYLIISYSKKNRMFQKDPKVRTRVDLTKGLFPYQRRLDALARLLASHSICVAVAVIGNRLFISANELHKNSLSNNKIMSSINSIMNYFKNLALGKIYSQIDRKNIFQIICSHSRLKKTIGKGSIPLNKDLIIDISDHIFEMDGEYTIDFILSHSANSITAALACM